MTFSSSLVDLQTLHPQPRVANRANGRRHRIRRRDGFVIALIGAALAFSPRHPAAAILAEWTCESPSTGPGAGACQSVSADDVGNGVIKYSSTADIAIEPVFDDQLNAKDAFTFSFNQQDSPPFNGLEDTTKNEELQGEIVGGVIKVNKIAADDIQLTWDSIYPGRYPALPADWQAAGGKQIPGDVELDYDPTNNNYITSLDVTLFVPEPSSLLLLASGFICTLFIYIRTRTRSVTSRLTGRSSSSEGISVPAVPELTAPT